MEDIALVALAYKNCYQTKIELLDTLRSLEKQYLKTLIHKCSCSQTVCENCWDIVNIRRGIHDHILNGQILCKKRTIEYQLLKIIDSLIDNKPDQPDQLDQPKNV